MKKFILILWFSVVLGQAMPLLAANAEHDYQENTGYQDQERIDHYAAAVPGTAKEALILLETKSAMIAQTLEKNILDSNDLETIHEASYSLEAAVERLRAEQNNKQEAILDGLDEAVQALHYASENHEEQKTREWFDKLKMAENEVKSVF